MIPPAGTRRFRRSSPMRRITPRPWILTIQAPSNETATSHLNAHRCKGSAGRRRQDGEARHHGARQIDEPEEEQDHRGDEHHHGQQRPDQESGTPPQGRQLPQRKGDPDVEHDREDRELDEKKQNRVVPLSEMSDYFAFSQLFPWHLESACEWLERKGRLQKVSAPFKLTKRSQERVEEPAYFLDV